MTAESTFRDSSDFCEFLARHPLPFGYQLAHSGHYGCPGSLAAAFCALCLPCTAVRQLLGFWECSPSIAAVDAGAGAARGFVWVVMAVDVADNALNDAAQFRG